tara:strand:+ start:2876 stop:3628 length:753 start_codon:yes stop_codon:yes gene_type:complete
MEEMDPKRVVLITCISVDYDLDYLYHFFKHYGRLDIDQYKVILHSKDKIDQDKILGRFQLLFKDIKAEYVLEFWTGVFKYYDKVDRLNSLIVEEKGVYYVLADVDEQQIWLDSIKSTISSNGNQVVWGRLRDREAPVNTNTTIGTTIDLNEQFPIISNKSNWKAELYYKPVVFNSSFTLNGCHDIMGIDKFKGIDDNNTVLDVDHYRWNDKRLDKMLERYENYKDYNISELTKDSDHVLSVLKAKHKDLL